MSSGDFTKTVFEFWKAQGEAFVKAQEQAGRAFADGMQAMAAGKMPTFQMASDDDLAKATQAMQDLWAAAGGLSSALAARMPSATGSETVETTFRHMLDPRTWLAGGGEMDEVLSRMSQGPRFADLWDMERRYARVMHAWTDMRRRSLEHNAVVLQAWMRAGSKFATQLAERNSGDQPAPDSHAMTALWAEIANVELIETQRSEAFLAAQSAMIRASTALRIAQQDLVEHAGKQYGFPTRTELDDVHKSVTELRREFRALKRATQTARPQAVPAIAAEPARAEVLPPRRRATRANGGARHDADRH
jgi:class III poly(R)-hydroxyalkanoic acid synthase PhaE subunit